MLTPVRVTALKLPPPLDGLTDRSSEHGHVQTILRSLSDNCWIDTETALPKLLREWMTKNNLCDKDLPGNDGLPGLLGAILATRAKEDVVNLVPYAETCLQRGVADGYLARAKRLLNKHKKNAVYTPYGIPDWIGTKGNVTMTTGHTDIIEVVTCSKKRVNLFLERGYRLLAVEPETTWVKPPKDVKRVEGYVLKFLTFVLGRPAGVEPFDPDKPKQESGDSDLESGKAISETHTTKGAGSES
jgi:hypothetical protein